MPKEVTKIGVLWFSAGESLPEGPWMGKENCRSLGCAPNDKKETGALSAACPNQAQKQGLNGAPNVRYRWRQQGHCSRNSRRESTAHTACRGGRDDKGEGSAHCSSRYRGMDETRPLRTSE